MAIHVLTGNPREGKTLWSVEMIVNAAKEGNRPIFSNITGLNVEGVQVAPPDWNELPNGAIAVYDEAQEIEHPVKVNKDGSPYLMYAATAKAGFETDPWLKNLSTHGKRGIDLYFITQHPTLIHHQIRKFTESHKHFVRTMGLQRASIYTWYKKTVTAVDERKEKAQAEVQLWKFPKDLYSKYKSADVHNIKMRIPKKAIFAVLAGVLTVGCGIWWINANFGGDDETKKTEKTDSQFSLIGGSTSETPTGFKSPVLESLHSSVKPTQSISGCVSGRFCRCFDQDGFLIDLTETMCRDLAQGNLALPIKITTGGGQSSAGTSLK